VVRVGERPVGTGRPGPIASRLLVRFRELAEALIGAHVGDS
jgi:hypothetical protein